MANFYKPQKKSRLTPSDINELTIERLSDDGRGIAKLSADAAKSPKKQGKTLFVEGALPGELVNAKEIHRSARYSEAYASEVIVPSQRRLEPICQHYSRCGGCHVQHMALEDQQSFKLQAVVEQLKKWANISPDAILPTLSADQYHYRRRVRLGVSSDKRSNNKPVLGFRQKRSHQLVKISECPVMAKPLEALIDPLQAWLNQHNVSVKHIELIESAQVIGVVIRHNQSVNTAARQALQAALLPFKAICWFQSDKQKQSCLEAVDGAKASPDLHYSLDDPKSSSSLSLGFHPNDFIQGNAKINQLMVNQVIELLQLEPHEDILDLFCGVGNFSLPLSRLAKTVTGVEGVEAMVLKAAHNAEVNQCHNARFLQADIFDWSEFISAGASSLSCDALVLDPPRAGAKILCRNINKLMPKRIVYVSCDSATFARDAQLLCKNNYNLSQLGVVDMFPQTSHSEVMGLFTHPSWY